MNTRVLTRAVVIACVVIGVVWRARGLDVFPGLDPDEVEGVLAWFRDSPLYWYVYPSGRPHLNPLAPLLHWPFETLFGPAAWAVRMPALLLGIAVIPATYLMIRRPFGAHVAACATVLVSAAPFLVAYSRLAWDLAYVPVLSSVLIGLAFERRWLATGVCLTGLVLIHPTALCLLPLAAAPFAHDVWVRAGRAGSPWLWRTLLSLIAVAGYFAVYSGLAVVSDTAGPGSVQTFVMFVWHGMTGALAYAEFLGAGLDVTLTWPALIAGALALAAGISVWRDDDSNGRLLLCAVVLGLAGQFISLGNDEVMTPVRARYFLWAVVPLCLMLSVVGQSVASRVRAPGAALVLCCGLAGFWLVTFHTRYLQAFARTGGTSASLDYRAASVQPKLQVLNVVRQHLDSSGGTLTLFVGEPRLQLVLSYLASKDPRIDVQNLGARLYSDQNDGRARLQLDFTSGPETALFVDYDWDNLDGVVREIHAVAARDVTAAVAPWTATALTSVTTADGRPLLKVWRLTR